MSKIGLDGAIDAVEQITSVLPAPVFIECARCSYKKKIANITTHTKISFSISKFSAISDSSR